MQPTAHIITIGDELLIGQVVDTNSAFIGAECATVGVRVREIISVSDNSEAIKRALKEGFEKSDIVIITGGLGPTKDDISKRSIADFFGLDLVRDSVTFEHVKELMCSRGVEFNALNQAQADIPRGFIALRNEVGTAPGLYYKQDSKLLFCLPGVPFEMKRLFTEQVIPIIGQNYTLQPVIKRTIMVYGLPESELAALINGWESALPPYISLAYLPNPNGIRLRLSSKTEVGAAEINFQFELLKTIIPDYFLGDEPTNVEVELSKLLTNSSTTLAVAESCTGGVMASKCTAISGASSWFLGSVTAYSNDVKSEVLGIENETLEEFGAVSSQTVEQMAVGVRELTGADYSIATSGIAGPTGATEGKELGDIWIGISSNKGTMSYKRNFGQPREVFVQRASTAALNYLRMAIIKGTLVIAVALSGIFTAQSQSNKLRTLDELRERLFEANYQVQISEQRVEKAKVNHTISPFLPTLSASASQQQRISSSATTNSFDIGSNLRWRLFDGLSMFYSYDITKENLTAEQLSYVARIELLVAEMSSRYYQIISYENSVKLRRQSVKLSRERYNEALSKYNIGAGSGLEMRLAKTDLNTDSTNLIKAEESLKLSYIALNNLLNYDENEVGYIKDTITVTKMPDQDSVMSMAMENNSDILISKSSISLAELSVKSAQALRYPTLDFVANYGFSPFNQMPSNFNSTQAGTWGFSLGVPIFNGLETNRRVKSAKIDSKIARISSVDIINDIEGDVWSALTSYRNALFLIELETQNAEAMELNMDIAMERYRLGDLSGIDFRNIQLQYLAAIERKITTLYSAKVTEIEILRLCGSLL